MSDQQPPPETPADPSAAEPDAPWYSSRAALVALIALALVAIFLLVGWLFWWGDDDTIDTAENLDGTTIPNASTIPDGSIVDGTTVPTIEVTLPPDTTAPATTIPATTMPPDTTAPATTAPATTTPETTAPAATMMEAITANPDLSRLAELITTAGLEGYIESNPLTLFAPDNDAFDAYEAANGPIDGADQVTAIIEGHGVEDLVDGDQMVGPTSVDTTAGSTLLIENSVVSVDGIDPPEEANATPDVDVANGFLYMIDKVLTTPAP